MADGRDTSPPVPPPLIKHARSANETMNAYTRTARQAAGVLSGENPDRAAGKKRTASVCRAVPRRGNADNGAIASVRGLTLAEQRERDPQRCTAFEGVERQKVSAPA